MSKLYYSFDKNAVTIVEHTAEKASEITDENTIQSVVFVIADVAKKLMDGETVKTLAGYGLQKLLQDRTSGTKEAGAKLKEMGELFTNFLVEGMWKNPAKASSGGTRTRKISATLATAVAELLGKTVIEAEASLQALDKERFEAICKNEKVVAAIKELEASVAVDDGALDGLLG